MWGGKDPGPVFSRRTDPNPGKNPTGLASLPKTAINIVWNMKQNLKSRAKDVWPV